MAVSWFWLAINHSNSTLNSKQDKLTDKSKTENLEVTYQIVSSSLTKYRKSWNLTWIIGCCIPWTNIWLYYVYLYTAANVYPFFWIRLPILLSTSMTSLLTHNVAHSTRHSFRPKTNNQPMKKFLSLAFSWVKVIKNWTSF